MPRVIDRDEVQRLMDHGAQLIDVLPKKEYAESHLPGAINIPLQSLNEKTVAQLRKDCSVIVYCYDYQSPRAAWRLDSLGFPEVFDYMPGKMDWLAYGLPVEKKVGAPPMLIERIERQVPTCRLKDLSERPSNRRIDWAPGFARS